MSVFQFSLTLSAKIETKEYDNKSLFRKIYDMVFGTEIWALVLILLCQDLPFFVLRFMLLVYNDELHSNYNLYFFAAKNFILVFFELYYIISIVIERNGYDKKAKLEATNFYDVETKLGDTINIDKEIYVTKV